MAINSALESSSTSAAMALSYIKPSGAPSSDSKRKRQLRRDVVNGYAQRVCYETFGPQVQQGSGPAQTPEWRLKPAHIDATRQYRAPLLYHHHHHSNQNSHEKVNGATEQYKKSQEKQRRSSIAHFNGPGTEESSDGLPLKDKIGFRKSHRISRVRMYKLTIAYISF